MYVHLHAHMHTCTGTYMYMYVHVYVHVDVHCTYTRMQAFGWTQCNEWSVPYCHHIVVLHLQVTCTGSTPWLATSPSRSRGRTATTGKCSCRHAWASRAVWPSTTTRVTASSGVTTVCKRWRASTMTAPTASSSTPRPSISDPSLSTCLASKLISAQ